jgi:hypothetical protein
MFVSGPAVVTMYKDYIINDSLLAIVAFFPIENYHNLHSGQELILNDNEIKKYLKTPITSLESKIIDPKTLQEKYYLYPSIKHIAVKPCVLTIAKLESINMNVPPALFLGSIININVKIGNRRLASFIPFLKLLFKDNK